MKLFYLLLITFLFTITTAGVNSQSYKKIDVTKSGLVNDGKTDNTEALKKLLELVKNERTKVELFFPAGTYVFNPILKKILTGIDLSDISNLTIGGEKDKTVLQLKGNTTYTRAMYLVNTNENSTNLLITNLVFDGNRKTLGKGDEQVHGMQISGKNIRISDCEFKEWFSDGIRIMGISDVYADSIRIENSRFIHNGRSGVTCQRAFKNSVISNNYFQNNSDQAIDFEPTGKNSPYNNLISGNLIENKKSKIAATLSGSTVEYPNEKVTFINNIIRNGALQAVKLKDAVIENNEISVDSFPFGIELSRTITNVAIKNNKITVPQGAGIRIYAANNMLPENVKIIKNEINVATPGILLESVKNEFRIENNSINNINGDGNGAGIVVTTKQTQNDMQDVSITNNTIKGFNYGVIINAEKSSIRKITVSNNIIKAKNTVLMKKNPAYSTTISEASIQKN